MDTKENAQLTTKESASEKAKQSPCQDPKRGLTNEQAASVLVQHLTFG